MSEGLYAQFAQIFAGQIRERPKVDGVFRKGRGVLPEPQIFQPRRDIVRRIRSFPQGSGNWDGTNASR
jgi:hypothetical protein